MSISPIFRRKKSLWQTALAAAWRRLATVSDRAVPRFQKWFVDDGCWYISSMFAHAFVLFALALITLSIPRSKLASDAATTLEPAEVPSAVSTVEMAPFDPGEVPIEPTELSPETLMQFKAEPIGDSGDSDQDDAAGGDQGGGTKPDRDAPDFGGMGGFFIPGVDGPAGRGGVGIGIGEGTGPGRGGAGTGFGQRFGSKNGSGATKASERAVGAALNWIARHQTKTGHWSLDFRPQCKGIPCAGPGLVQTLGPKGVINYDNAATAMALLPFLGAGQTHKTKGPYQECVRKGLAWLIKQQEADGNLGKKSGHPMYDHGMATLALCEAYGMTKDPMIGEAARKAVVVIEQAQNEATGGWRYVPQEDGDTSVFGWQMMALKSAKLAGLAVDSAVWENANKWLHGVAKGRHLGLYVYRPYGESVIPSMTAVGMLCSQYLGAGRNDPAMLEGMGYILENLPDNKLNRNTYYWYYATLAMHNIGGPEWDSWHRKMRRVLIDSQVRQGCAMGSWDPVKPTVDFWGEKGGRLMMTSFNAMTLEVYYRYLPLFNTDELVPMAPRVKIDPNAKSIDVHELEPTADPPADPPPDQLVEPPADAGQAEATDQN